MFRLVPRLLGTVFLFFPWEFNVIDEPFGRLWSFPSYGSPSVFGPCAKQRLLLFYAREGIRPKARTLCTILASNAGTAALAARAASLLERAPPTRASTAMAAAPAVGGCDGNGGNERDALCDSAGGSA